VLDILKRIEDRDAYSFKTSAELCSELTADIPNTVLDDINLRRGKIDTMYLCVISAVIGQM
jgi:hypothetical protein